MNLCLVVVFNHRFDRNLPLLREYYSGKFSKVVFLMPFADDLECDNPDVISVHHGSYLFQGFFAEAGKRLGETGCDGFVIIGDDLLLNPALDERNLHPRLGLDPGHGYTKSLASLYDAPLSWSRLRDTYRAFFSGGFKWQGLLPSREEAFEKSRQYGIEHQPLGLRNFGRVFTRQWLSSVGIAASWLGQRDDSRKLFQVGSSGIPYPAFYGYSDFLIIPAPAWNDFARYCQVTAAMQLFVESAIPLCMVLACDFVETELEYGTLFDAQNPARRMRMRGIELQWSNQDRLNFEREYDLDLQRLLAGFPEDVIYFHPVKLSQWKNFPALTSGSLHQS